MHDPVRVDVERDLDLRDAARRRRDADQLQLAQGLGQHVSSRCWRNAISRTTGASVVDSILGTSAGIVVLLDELGRRPDNTANLIDEHRT